MIRRCNCAHANLTSASVSSTNNDGMESVDTYVAPTRALLLQLVNFPSAAAAAGTSSASSISPLRAEFHSRGTSMKLKWQEQAPNGNAATSSSSSSLSMPSFSTTPSLSLHHSAALRLLGLSTEEALATTVRQKDLEVRASVAGVTPAPASIYPSAFGQARMELASNDLALFELSRSHYQSIQQTHGERFTQHLNPPVFLQPQIADEFGDSQASPFQSSPVLPVHSSIPLTTNAQRSSYIRAIVKHVAHRLGITATSSREASAMPADASTTSPAHILLLYLDAQILLGESDEAADPRIAQQFAEQLLTALATQLHSMPDAPSLEQVKTQLTIGASATYPPTATSLLPASRLSQPADTQSAFGSSGTTAPQHAASLLLSSPTVLCPQLMWSFLEPELDPVPSAAVRSGNRMLDLIRPVQTFQVQDGFIDRRTNGWKTYSASVYHFDSMRVATNNEWNHQSNPVHGEINLAHFIKEIVFKIGRGNKYGA